MCAGSFAPTTAGRRRRATRGRGRATRCTLRVGSRRRRGRRCITPRATCAGATEVAAFTRFERDWHGCVCLVRARREQPVERRVAVARGVRAVGTLLFGLLHGAPHGLPVELGRPPDLRWRGGTELEPVESEHLLVLRAVDLVLVFECDELRGVVELPANDVMAELAVAAGEELVLVPDDVDDLRRRDVVMADCAEIDELFVLSNRQESELVFPAMLPCNLGREGARECVGFTERRLDLVEHGRRYQVAEAVLAQTDPEFFLHAISPFLSGNIPVGMIA